MAVEPGPVLAVGALAQEPVGLVAEPLERAVQGQVPLAGEQGLLLAASLLKPLPFRLKLQGESQALGWQGVERLLDSRWRWPDCRE